MTTTLPRAAGLRLEVVKQQDLVHGASAFRQSTVLGWCSGCAKRQGSPSCVRAELMVGGFPLQSSSKVCLRPKVATSEVP
jgi:hypothetical protein